MKSYLVSYNLDDENDYDKISGCLKSFSEWCKIFQRIWIIKSNENQEVIRNLLINSINNKGRILVVDITNSIWYGFNLNDKVVDWMKENV